MKITVMGVDPGLASTGWGLVESQKGRMRCIGQGTVKTSSRSDLPQRLKIIYDAILEVMLEYRPELLSVESLFFSKNRSSAIPVAHGRGILLLCAEQQGIKVAEYGPGEIKQAVVGHGKADKHQVESMVRLLLGDIPGKTTDHSMDALASAICGIHREAALV